MKTYLYLLTGLTTCLLCGPADAAICRPGVDLQAEQLYRSALQANTYEQRLSYLNQAEQHCQSFQIALNKGKSLLKLKQYPEAITALNNAETLVSNQTPAKAQLYSLQGKAHMQEGHLLEARIYSEMANDLFRLYLKQPVPESLQDTLAALDDLDLRRIVPKSEITRQLEAKKGAGIMPAVSLIINFDTDQASLSPLGLKQIRQLALALQGYIQSYNVLLIGHTDQRGTESYNMQLSVRRANTVADYLKLQYPNNQNHFSTRGKGETQLRYSGTSQQDHRRNRRVEVNLLLLL